PVSSGAAPVASAAEPSGVCGCSTTASGASAGRPVTSPVTSVDGSRAVSADGLRAASADGTGLSVAGGSGVSGRPATGSAFSGVVAGVPADGTVPRVPATGPGTGGGDVETGGGDVETDGGGVGTGTGVDDAAGGVD